MAALPGLESLLDRLIRDGVEFVVVGGLAAVAHGASILTQDLDICCSFTVDNLMRLQSAIVDLHPVHRMVPSRSGLQNLYLSTDWGQLDCLGAILGIGAYEQVRGSSVEITLASGSCRVLGIDALIRAKETMGRDRDREAVLQLRAIRERTR